MDRSATPTIPSQSDHSDIKAPSLKSKLAISCSAILVFIFVYLLLSMLIFKVHEEEELGVVRSDTRFFISPEISPSVHSFPDTSDGIHVFNDQLTTWEMSEEQFKFAATHYAGTQKIFASDARRFRANNPNFIVLNYRLGMGLGYQNTGNQCETDGSWLQVIEGERWIREFPDNPRDEWFYKIDEHRVLFCDWGWYLMDISNPSWQKYWAHEVLRQLHTNKADGVFVDGLFPPNYYGGDRFKPELPVMDQSFENTWSKKVEDFIDFAQTGDLAEYYLIANVGQWITGRDITDYSQADGILVEGFSRWADGTYFSTSDKDWQLQLDRILGMVRQNKIVILQQYVNKENEKDRIFLLGSYLLIKGSQSFINLEYSSSPEWFPEYEIPIGQPIGESPEAISALWRSDWGIYARYYSEGLVLVNPSDEAKKVPLFQNYFNALPFGGGEVPPDGDLSNWTNDYAQVTNIDLGPHQAAILLNHLPAK